MAEVTLESVSKRYAATTAVAELSFSVDDGEFVVLLGPTGAGKTTTLRLIAGLETPDEGRVLIGKTDVTTQPIANRDTAFVFQQYSLYPHLSVFDNLAFPLRSPLRKQSKSVIRARVHEITKRLRIDDKLDNRATELSGGEMQRVAIGRALVREPAVFLMDEPLSSLDAKLREDLRIELKRIQLDLGATVLYVTHDQVEAMTLADRIGVLADGRLVQLDTPRAVYTKPVDTYVAQRLGSPPINLLPAGSFNIESPANAARMGIRPEDLYLNGRTIPGRRTHSFRAQVRQVEHLGAETVIVLSTPDQNLHALADSGFSIRPGEAVHVRINPDTVLFFDSHGQRLKN